MTWFYAGVAGLSVFSVLLLLGPRWHRRRWQGESNLDWLVLRREELAAETGRSAEQLNLEAELRVLDEAADGPSTSTTGDVATRRDWRVLGPVLLLLVVLPPLLYLRLGAIEDVRIADALAGLEDATPTEIQSLLGAIEARSAARPGKLITCPCWGSTTPPRTTTREPSPPTSNFWNSSPKALKYWPVPLRPNTCPVSGS